MVCGGQVEHRQFDLPNYEQRPSRRGKGGIASFGSLACMKQYYFWPTPQILFLKKTMTMPTGRRRFGQDFLPQLLTGVHSRPRSNWVASKRSETIGGSGGV